jgi:RimJ/RimL family protein N-acetyltransferase
MNYILETNRLSLKEFTREDAFFIIELLNSPGWLQFIGDRNVKTNEQAIAYLENGPLKSYSDNKFGLWMVELKETKTAIGMCGLIKRDSLENPDIGFAFLPSYVGKGYAFEIASATLAFAKDTLGIQKISAITVGSNSRSIRLLEKTGFRFIKTFRFPGSEENLSLYSN